VVERLAAVQLNHQNERLERQASNINSVKSSSQSSVLFTRSDHRPFTRRSERVGTRRAVHGYGSMASGERTASGVYPKRFRSNQYGSLRGPWTSPGGMDQVPGAMQKLMQN
jgi:hypothetical protein